VLSLGIVRMLFRSRRWVEVVRTVRAACQYQLRNMVLLTTVHGVGG
jgi:hypothetical protein